jgi:hypothetical protein
MSEDKSTLNPGTLELRLSLETRQENLGKLQSLVQEYLSQEWVNMVTDYKFMENTSYTDATGRTVEYLGLRDASAAKSNHHDYQGGLVQHFLEMWDYWQVLKSTFPPCTLLTDARILAGILLHDLHKAWCYYHPDPEDATKISYGSHPSSGFLRDDQKTAYLIQQYKLPVDLIQLNALYHSEGGWAECPPKWNTVLAKLLYLLDELSGNVLARIDKTPEGQIAVMGDRGRLQVLREGSFEL